MTEQRIPNIALAGNPNCGKTTLFNHLTGGKQRIGNWPGVTVEKKEGAFVHQEQKYNVIDLPGIYSLSAYSEDERVARNFLLSGNVDLVVNIIDSTNLERNLYLTTQLIEMKVPLVVVLNMMDLVKKKQMKIDVEHLEQFLGCPVIPISAINKKDVDTLKDSIAVSSRKQPRPQSHVSYANEIEEAIETMLPRLEAFSKTIGANPRWTAIKVIENDDWVQKQVVQKGIYTLEEIEQVQTKIEHILEDEPDILIADYRYGFIHSVVRHAVQRKRVKKEMTENIDKVVLNRFLGIPIFLAIMYGVFWFTISFGSAFIDFFDILFGAIFVDGFAVVLDGIGSPQWLTTILSSGLGAGIQTVATFIPIIFTMFLMLSILEDSGYMARAAFVMDRFMKFLGLPGKAFVPMLVGFGCTVPAIMATRTLENRRDRMLTVMMTPFMSCGARLPVYALFATAFFPHNGQNIVFSLYLVGIFMAIVSGLIFKRTLFVGEPAPFVMELPPYHFPRFYHIMMHTWNRLKGFIWRAGKVIILMVLILAFLNSLGTDGSFGNEDSDQSVLAAIGKSITPIFHPMGIEEENWPATVSIFTGLFAKEAVVGTMNALYSIGEGESDEAFEFWPSIHEAFASIPANLASLGDSFSDPAGIQLGEVSDQDVAAEEMEVSTSIFATMRKRFNGPSHAYSYLLFILVYIPCGAAVGAAYKEIGPQLTAVLSVYLILLAWVVATIFYQITVGHSGFWIFMSILLFAAMFFSFKWMGKRSHLVIQEKEAHHA